MSETAHTATNTNLSGAGARVSRHRESLRESGRRAPAMPPGWRRSLRREVLNTADSLVFSDAQADKTFESQSTETELVYAVRLKLYTKANTAFGQRIWSRRLHSH